MTTISEKKALAKMEQANQDAVITASLKAPELAQALDLATKKSNESYSIHQFNCLGYTEIWAIYKIKSQLPLILQYLQESLDARIKIGHGLLANSISLKEFAKRGLGISDKIRVKRRFRSLDLSISLSICLYRNFTQCSKYGHFISGQTPMPPNTSADPSIECPACVKKAAKAARISTGKRAAALAAKELARIQEARIKSEEKAKAKALFEESWNGPLYGDPESSDE